MIISTAGIKFIQSNEGLSLKSYFCPAGKCTAGYGHCGDDVKPNTVYSQAQCDAWLQSDLKTAETAVNRLVKVPLSQSEYDSLVDFSFNIGITAFANSTLLRLLNSGDKAGASLEFEKWVKGGGKTLPGLVTRRAAEKKLFLTP